MIPATTIATPKPGVISVQVPVPQLPAKLITIKPAADGNTFEGCAVVIKFPLIDFCKIVNATKRFSVSVVDRRTRA